MQTAHKYSMKAILDSDVGVPLLTHKPYQPTEKANQNAFHLDSEKSDKSVPQVGLFLNEL